jgi:hypothetical protein
VLFDIEFAHLSITFSTKSSLVHEEIGLVEAAAACPKALHHQGFNSGPGWIRLHGLPPIVIQIYDCALAVPGLACGGTTSRLYIDRECCEAV